jgi:hypothetical protein
MDKSHVLAEIRRLAKLHGGHIGVRAFLDATGIPEKQILGKFWATWNQALVEAGVSTKAFRRPRTDREIIVAAVATLVERLEKWPTENEMALERRGDKTFPSLQVIRRTAKEVSLPALVQEYCRSHPELPLAARIASERSSITTDSPEATSRAPVAGYVYMMRSGRRYKIGFTSSPARRHREVRLELPDPTNLVHSIPTDDPAGIEAYWHKRFASKRVRDTEFFELEGSDVMAFKRRKYQ